MQENIAIKTKEQEEQEKYDRAKEVFIDFIKTEGKEPVEGDNSQLVYLKDLSQQVGQNKERAIDFQKSIINWLKAEYPKLKADYDAFLQEEVEKSNKKADFGMLNNLN